VCRVVLVQMQYFSLEHHVYFWIAQHWQLHLWPERNSFEFNRQGWHYCIIWHLWVQYKPPIDSTVIIIFSFYIIPYFISMWICHECRWSHSDLRPAPQQGEPILEEADWEECFGNIFSESYNKYHCKNCYNGIRSFLQMPGLKEFFKKNSMWILSHPQTI